jgi:CelD/BcsL family acetyltransferase involved in cellulose biosynthesis
MVEVVEINDVEELSSYRMLWNSFFTATPNASFFLTIDWLEACWRHFGHRQKLRVLIPYAGGEPLGILPLCVRREKHRLSTLRVLTYPLDNWGTWYGPIGPNPAATMLAAMQHIRRTPRDWDMIELRWVAADDTEGGKSARALRFAGMLSEKKEYQQTSIVDLPRHWSTFLAGKSNSLRRHYRQGVRELIDSGRAEFIRHRPAPATEGDGNPGWHFYDMCEAVARVSWQAEVKHGNTLTHRHVRDFFRDAHASAARLGMADINVLKVDGQPAAFLYGHHCRGHVTALRTGFDPAIGGVGSALIFQALKDSCDRGDHMLDFGSGEGEHKRRLRTRTQWTYRLTYTPIDSWRSQAVRITRWAKNRWPSSPIGEGIAGATTASPAV